MAKGGNVEINNSPKVGIEPGPLDLKSSTLPNELQRYHYSAVLVVVLINPNHYKLKPIKQWIDITCLM